MRWWGWGDTAQAGALPAHALDFLRGEIGVAERERPPVALERVRIEEPRLSPDARAALAAVVGADRLRDDHAARVLHAAGKGYVDLVRMRAGDPEDAPDAVVYPTSHEQVSELLGVCAQRRVAIVPFGGGTSVVGGVAPLRGACDAVVALDLRGLDRLAAVDRDSLTAFVEGGVRAPALEAKLAGHGLTLGHFPQSYEYVSIGGCVATRSAGQASTGYGRIDELVIGVRCAAPSGELELPAVPASAAGPDLRELIVGSEGTLGVITQAALRVRPRPAETRYEGFFFESFEHGTAALRAAVQTHLAPDVARLSDEQETRLTLMLAGGGFKDRLGRAYLRARGYAGGCVAICGWEGDSAAVARRRAHGAALLRAHGALALGRSPGKAWSAGRFHGPYLRDQLLDHGVMVETLETATQWSRLTELWRAVAAALDRALRARGTPPLVLCHVSHLYETGASLYFTFIARQQEGAEIEQWHTAKVAASDAIVAAGATITHHHAIGRDHVPWLGREIGDTGLAALRALKRELDPAGIMNPGKLL